MVAYVIFISSRSFIHLWVMSAMQAPREKCRTPKIKLNVIYCKETYRIKKMKVKIPTKVSVSICKCIQILIYLLYVRHYNPQNVYSLPPFYSEEWFILQTIYALKTQILHFLSLKSTVYTQELLLIKSGV